MVQELLVRDQVPFVDGPLFARQPYDVDTDPGLATPKRLVSACLADRELPLAAAFTGCAERTDIETLDDLGLPDDDAGTSAPPAFQLDVHFTSLSVTRGSGVPAQELFVADGGNRLRITHIRNPQ